MPNRVLRLELGRPARLWVLESAVASNSINGLRVFSRRLSRFRPHVAMCNNVRRSKSRRFDRPNPEKGRSPGGQPLNRADPHWVEARKRPAWRDPRATAGGGGTNRRCSRRRGGAMGDRQAALFLASRPVSVVGSRRAVPRGHGRHRDGCAMADGDERPGGNPMGRRRCARRRAMPCA